MRTISIKTFLLVVCGWLATAQLKAQTPSSTHNYVMETTVRSYNNKTTSSLTSLPVDSANRSIQYIDGLGRPMQMVQWQASPGKKDLVRHFAYDMHGREAYKYLPYAEQNSNDATFKSSALTNQASFYNSSGSWDANIAKTPYPFSETVFESSPLNRVLEQGAPGASWQPVVNSSAGHTVKTEYGANAASDIKFWTVTSTGATAGYYAANKLYKTVIKDENWVSGLAGTTEEYKDIEGRVVLKRVWETGSVSLSTYYVYDDFGNLRYVIPPAVTVSSFVVSDNVFKQFIYGYEYDGRNRVIKKHIPGKGWEHLAYNLLDQVMFTQDEVQRAAVRWTFYKYDAFGRVIMTGIYQDDTEFYLFQSNLNGLGLAQWETRTTGTPSGYTNASYPTVSVLDTLTINYYDDYDFPGGSTYSYGSASSMTKGLQTGSKVRVLGTSKMLLSLMYYDDKARNTKSFSQHYLADIVGSVNYDEITNTYNFPGELTSSTRIHHTYAGNTTIANRYKYDHVGRKQQTWQKMNGNTEVLLSEQIYNEIGQLKEKQLHNGLQATKYAYNERGWLKRGISPQFQLKLGYDTLSTPQYNGNISTQEWGTSFANKYLYTYDGLNRLSSGISSGVSMSEVLTYDVMGNIQTLNRDGAGVSTYSYTGNRLDSISGSSVSTGSYAYDVNGNATTDGRNGVTLTYNLLNLPSTVTKSGLTMAYTYDGTGRKLKKISSDELPSEYIDGIQYWNGALDFVMTEEGRARKQDTTYSYEYDLKDHLGNVRYSFDISGGSVRRIQQQDYYAFGKIKESDQYVFGVKNKYLYNSKELQEELGQLDYGARFYDPVIGRWNVVDPLAEKMRRHSPYNYAFNNPIRFVDPDGMIVDDWVKKDDVWTWDDNIKSEEQAKAAGYDDYRAPGSIIENAKLGKDGLVGDIYLGENSSDAFYTLSTVEIKGVSPLSTFSEENKEAVDATGLVVGVGETGAKLMKNDPLASTSLADKTSKVLGNLGKFVGAVAAVNDGMILYNKYNNGTATSADWIKFGISVGTVVLRTNPYAAIGYGFMDMVGYNPVDLILDTKR